MSEVPSQPGDIGGEAVPQSPRVTAFCPSCGERVEAGASCVCVDKVATPAPTVKSTFGSLRLAAALYGAYLVVILGQQVVYLVMGDTMEPEFEVRATLVTDVLFAIISMAALWRARREVGPMLRLPRQRRWLAYGAGLSLVTYMLATLIASVWTRLFRLDDVPIYSEPFINSELSPGVAILLSFVSIAVFPALSEEIGFRGVIASTLGRTLDGREAALVTALLFASLHINPFMFVGLFCMGLLLAFIVAKSGSLLPGMVLHFCHNAFCVLHELVPEFP